MDLDIRQSPRCWVTITIGAAATVHEETLSVAHISRYPGSKWEFVSQVASVFSNLSKLSHNVRFSRVLPPVPGASIGLYFALQLS